MTGVRRVSARRGPRLPVAPPAHVDFAAAKAVRVEKRATLRSATLALFQPGIALYSVEVAGALGCTVTAAQQSLAVLERDGLLVSTLLPAPRSGNGRRTYRRAP